MTNISDDEPLEGIATIVRASRIFDGVHDDLLTDHEIRIGHDGRILAVAPRSTARALASRARVIDLEEAVVSPGLINCHVHLGLALPGAAGELLRGGSDADLLLAMADSARRTLHAGVTTVRLVGESRSLDFALRRGIRAGAVAGPHIFTAGQALCCTGGHGWDSDALEADGPDEFRRLTRRQIREGADLIKVCISGGIAGEHEQISTPQLFDDEIAAVIEVAHAWGRKVTAHAGPGDTVRRAVALGLDCVEHGYDLDDETTALMSRSGVWYVPTITVSRCADYFDQQGVPGWMKDRALAAGPRHWESLRSAIAHGVPIAMGTDMPPAADFEGTTATVREMEFMQDAGMTALDVMRSATSAAATLLDAPYAGRIVPGATADVIATSQDPTTDVSELRSMFFVMKEGRVVRDDRNDR